MNDFLKGILITGVPTAALSILSAVGVRNATGEGGILFAFLWVFGVIVFIVTLIIGLAGAPYQQKARGRAGAGAGIGIGIASLGLSCFAMFQPSTSPVPAPTISVPYTMPPRSTPAGQPPVSIPTTTAAITTAPMTTRLSPTPPYPGPPQLTVGKPTINGQQVTINGVTMPGAPGTTITRINWNWGDGQSEDHWFPASHTYGAEGLYAVKVTSFQSNGQWTIQLVAVRIGLETSPTPLVTQSGSYSGFYNLPLSFFQESKVQIDSILKVTDAQYLSLKKMHNGIAPYIFCKIEYEATAYGFTTPTGLKLGDAAFPQLNSGNPRWEVLAHEQGHNFFGGTSAFYSTLATPFPFLQESLAVAGAFYTYHDITENRSAYGIDDASISSLNADISNGRMYQQSMLSRYVQEGKRFDITQVLTSQALDMKMISYGEMYGWQGFQRLARAFENEIGGRFTFQRDGASAMEQSTYIVAALGVAFGKDFRSEFRDLNFPIDEALYHEVTQGISAYLGG